MPSLRDAPAQTIIAPATPAGEGALGVVRLSGPGAWPIALGFLKSSGVPPAELRPEPRKILPARVLDGEVLLDQALAVFFRSPRSYTGEDTVEISCHGSPYILSRLLELGQSRGARLAEPGEFTLRAFLNGKMDLAQAEAVCHLIRARTSWAHRSAARQLEGRLSERTGTLRRTLLELLAHVEANLDHSEEDIPLLSEGEFQSRCGALLQEIEALSRTFRVGRLIQEGARIAIAGCPNVGKSSLLNALLRAERAIVSPAPGTTRDTLEEALQWDGLPVVLIDTAGLRAHTLDPVEALGMERTRKAVEASDLVLLVLDESRALTADDKNIMREMRRYRGQGKRVVLVFNKSDLGSSPLILNGDSFEHAVRVSAKTGEGLDALLAAVRRCLDLPEALADAPETQMIASQRHRRCLERAAAELESARAATGGDLEGFGEIVAVHLRGGLDSLAGITGETTTEDVLGSIFSQFCVGK